MWELDYYSIIHTAERRGRAEGFEAGRAEGFEAGLEKGQAKMQSMMQTKYVKAMKAKGMSVAEIADITGLQEEEIEQMQ